MGDRNLFMNFDTSHFEGQLRENKSEKKKNETRYLSKYREVSKAINRSSIAAAVFNLIFFK